MKFESHLGDLSRVLHGIEPADTAALLQAIREADRSFLVGSGRSGLVAQALAMRLAASGHEARLVGEASAPAYGSSDLLIVVSGSGRAPVPTLAAEAARASGGTVALLTATALAPLHRLAHVEVLLPPVLPATLTVEGDAVPATAQVMEPVRTLFTQACLIYVDSLVPALLQASGLTEDEMEERRPNLG